MKFKVINLSFIIKNGSMKKVKWRTLIEREKSKTRLIPDLFSVCPFHFIVGSTREHQIKGAKNTDLFEKL